MIPARHPKQGIGDIYIANYNTDMNIMIIMNINNIFLYIYIYMAEVI